MKVVILAGGFGTRIRDVADDIPKPMIPIGRYPIVWHIMKWYASFGHKDFVLCLGHQGNVIKNFFLNYEANTRDITLTLGNAGGVEYLSEHDESDWRVTLADTGLNAMTGARIRRVRRHLEGQEFMLTYGDGVSDVNIDELVAFHRSHGRVLTVTGVRPPGRFGEIESTANCVVSGFNEKPQATGGRISGGYFVASPQLFEYLDDNENLVFERGPLEALVRDQQLMMFEHDGFWQPMDTSRDYQYLNGIYAEGKAPWVP